MTFVHSRSVAAAAASVVVVLVVVLALVPPRISGGAASAAGPSFRLSSTSVYPGQTVTARGSRFAKRTDGVLLWSADGSQLASFTTSSTGSFSVRFTVPDVPAGTYTVTPVVGASAATAGRISASLKVKHQSTPTSTPQPTATKTATPQPTATSTPQPTATKTATPQPTATSTPQPTATKTATPQPTSVVGTTGLPSECSGLSYSRVVNVSTFTQLQNAVGSALPGDMIVLADGTYVGRVYALTSGTADSRITLCGTKKAIIDGGTITTGDAVTIKGNYWRLSGFSVTDAIQGVAVKGGNHNEIRNLEVFGIGQAGIHLYLLASDNLVEGNYIHDTGLYIAEYGEGVYIGSAYTQWCNLTGCNPDRSDRNRVVGNTIGPNVSAESVDIKEGTTGGEISGNSFNGVGMVSTPDYIDSWVDVKGNGYTISNNNGSVARRYGFEVNMQTSGWGQNNVFHGNSVNIQSGTGFKVNSGTVGTIVGCDNTVSPGVTLSNIACTP